MSTDSPDNRAVIRRFHDATNSGDPEQISRTIDELVEPDAMIRTPLPTDATGPEVLKLVFGWLLGAFPDLRVTIEDLISEGDKVVSRNTVTGTHLGDYMGHPATGRRACHEDPLEALGSSRRDRLGVERELQTGGGYYLARPSRSAGQAVDPAGLHLHESASVDALIISADGLPR